MSELSAEIDLRPTRIGFLVRPTDLASVRKVMRASACLWGGIYNPIIPVFDRPPKEWKSDVYERFKGSAVAKGYIRFFEPDIYVEAEKGLLEQAGLGAIRQEHAMYPQIIALTELFERRDNREWSKLQVGLSIRDVLAHIYRTEQQFVLREKRDSLVVRPQRGNALVEAMFGVYPTSRDFSYFAQNFTEVYKANKVDANPDTWRRVFRRNAEIPLWVTRYGLNTTRYWYHNLVVFVFDPSRATDLIDLWNLRLEPHPVLPVPREWFETLADDIFDLLKSEHRPVIGNPHGVMHNATIEFGRSITKSDAEILISKLKPELPQGALVVKYWRNRVWIDHRDDRVHRDGRLKVVAKDQRADLVVKEDQNQLRTTFTTLEPEFAERYGGGNHRWVNVLRVSNYSDKSIASVLPFNTFDRAWPRIGLGGEQVPIGGEGWVYSQQHRGLGQYVTLLQADEAIVGSFGHRGIKAKLSEPGHIAKQMLEHLGGLRGVSLIADLETLNLVNKMAGGHRRSATLKEWIDLISRRKERRHHPWDSLESFTKRNVIRLGLETDCPHCMAKNWNTLTAVDYHIVCERCLKSYEFPQANLRQFNRNWTYRVVGPFSVPDYGRGSYGAILALRVLSMYRSAMDRLTYATAMELDIDGESLEVDFVAWHAEERMQETHRPPQLVIGEAKSFGKGELITADEIAKLKAVATKLPEAVIAVAVLRDDFTKAEKMLLKRFVAWGRRANIYGEPTNPVLLLTSHELTMDHYISSTWKELGGEHAKFSDYDHTRSLLSFADATQQIYLGVSSFDQERRQYWDARHKRRLARQKQSGAGIAN